MFTNRALVATLLALVFFARCAYAKGPYAGGDEVFIDPDYSGNLTAPEAASLDLRGVEWVVLSACDTGTGEIADGEGVLGLRRAFEVAGAGALITSLWPVADDATGIWMREFYSAHLRDELSLAESVRFASQQLLADPRTAHPYYWGAFVASGSN